METFFSNLAITAAGAIALSWAVERGLSFLFGWKHYVKHLSGKGLKAPIAFGVSLCACNVAGFDIISGIFSADANMVTLALTAGIVAGGSKKVAQSFGELKEAIS